jgi:hypothetical protein
VRFGSGRSLESFNGDIVCRRSVFPFKITTHLRESPASVSAAHLQARQSRSSFKGRGPFSSCPLIRILFFHAIKSPLHWASAFNVSFMPKSNPTSSPKTHHKLGSDDSTSRMTDLALRKKKNADAQAAFRARRANYIATLEETGSIVSGLLQIPMTLIPCSH